MPLTRDSILATAKAAEDARPLLLRAIAIMSDHQLALLAVSQEYRAAQETPVIRAKRLKR